jgi:uncharacterized protein
MTVPERSRARIGRHCALPIRVLVVLAAWLVAGCGARVLAQASLPELTRPVNDFAGVIDADSAAQMDRMIRALDAASGDAVVVATVPSLEGWAGIEEYANKLFQNNGRGIGRKGKDNGVLILVAPKDRKARIEVGYDLEQWITDGYAGETIREFMAPRFRQNDYGGGLLAATTRIAGRIAQARGVTLEGVPQPAVRRNTGGGMPLWVIILIFILFVLLSRGGGGPGRRSRYWGGGGWSGWSSGVGPFGGGWSSGGGGGFGGGFGGFGGGSSGGGGASGSW